MNMKRWEKFGLIAVVVLIFAAVVTLLLIGRGFKATSEPSNFEKVLARRVRNYAIPNTERDEKNPLGVRPETLKEAREHFIARCSVCHGSDGRGLTQIGRNLYPRVPDLLSPETQSLTDGELHYIIANGVQLTGMPAWDSLHQETEDDSWKFVLFIRELRPLTEKERSQEATTSDSAHYVGSQSCQKCHAAIYEHWRKTPMANVVRDPREHPEAIIPNLTTNTIAKFTRDDIALVYGSVWKQRYFTKRGDDYFPEPAQWDVTHRVWRPYFVTKGTDWWEPFYPPDNLQRPTGRPATDAIPSIMTSTLSKRPNGTSAVRSAMAPVVSTSHIPLAETF